MDLNTDQIRSLILIKLGELGLKDVIAVKAGNQNYVYTYTHQEALRIAKVTDSRHRSLEALNRQSKMLSELNSYNAAVCAPIKVTDDHFSLEVEIEGISFYVIAYPFAEGVNGDEGNPKHVQLMGNCLAELHNSMQRLKPYPFSKIVETDVQIKESLVVGDLRGAEAVLNNAVEHFQSSEVQLIHGDFHEGNLKIKNETITVFDFDNCIYASRSYELANSLYMVLFDQMTQGELVVYELFKKRFLEAYQEASNNQIDNQIIDDLIGYRVLLLASWLSKPDDAPLFVRQSSQEWLNTLDGFVKAYFE